MSYITVGLVRYGTGGNREYEQIAGAEYDPVLKFVVLHRHIVLCLRIYKSYQRDVKQIQSSFNLSINQSPLSNLHKYAEFT